MAQSFLQIHTLTNYPASLLNRDDAGFAKRMPFGGAVRTRISSQCLKRHWRTFEGENGLNGVVAPESIRSRISFERYVVDPLKSEGVPEVIARAAAEKLTGMVFGGEAKEKKAEKQQAKSIRKASSSQSSPSEGPGVAKTAQVTVLGRPELEYLCQVARDAIAEAGGLTAKPDDVEAQIEKMLKAKDFKKNLLALKPGTLAAGLGAALFGRMVTGDILARTDAAIHVAHAMTVHAQATESDYFSAIDDLVREEGEQGSGHINASELTSGLFYGYVVVDVGGLVKNLGDDRRLAGEVTERLVHLVATVSPGAKKGSTAPYAYSHLVLVEGGKAQPRTLANAFLDPLRSNGDVVESAYTAMSGHLADLDGMYGKREQRAHAGLKTGSHFSEPSKPLKEIAQWARGQVEDVTA